MPTFSERLKELRTSHGWSQQLLANYLKISKSSVNMYERGEREPGIEVLESVADIFNVDMDYLIGRTDIPNKYQLKSNQDIMAKESLIFPQFTEMDNIREYLRNRIAFYLEQKHLTQKELADFLGVSQSTTTDWIKGKNSPNIERVAKMCELFDCKISDLIDPMKQTNSYGPYKNVFQKYIRLDDHGKRVADYIINEEYNRLYPPTKSDKPEQPTIEIIFIDNALASAGIGEMMGDVDQEKISVPETPTTRRADFAIRVRGDSMEPEYYDDDIVLVRKTDYVDKGDIGIFVVDGETYIKKCGGDRLISLNPKYADITGDEETRIYTMGEVIGKL